jgi:ribosomal protein S21
LAKVLKRKNEDIDSLLKRFKSKCDKEGVTEKLKVKRATSIRNNKYNGPGMT